MFSPCCRHRDVPLWCMWMLTRGINKKCNFRSYRGTWLLWASWAGLICQSLGTLMKHNYRNHCLDMTTEIQKACLARIPAHQAGQGTTKPGTRQRVTQYFLSTASSLSVEMALLGRLFPSNTRINIQWPWQNRPAQQMCFSAYACKLTFPGT